MPFIEAEWLYFCCWWDMKIQKWIQGPAYQGWTYCGKADISSNRTIQCASKYVSTIWFCIHFAWTYDFGSFQRVIAWGPLSYITLSNPPWMFCSFSQKAPLPIAKPQSLPPLSACFLTTVLSSHSFLFFFSTTPHHTPLLTLSWSGFSISSERSSSAVLRNRTIKWGTERGIRERIQERGGKREIKRCARESENLKRQGRRESVIVCVFF